MILTSLPEITGTGAVVNLGTIAAANGIATQGKWAQISALSGNSGVARVGGASTSSSRGLPIPSATGIFLPPNGAEAMQFVDLHAIYVYIANGDKVNVLYGG